MGIYLPVGGAGESENLTLGSDLDELRNTISLLSIEISELNLNQLQRQT